MPKSVSISPPSPGRGKRTLILGAVLAAAVILDTIFFFVMNSADAALFFRFQGSFFLVQVLLLVIAPAIGITGWRMASMDLKMIREGKVNTASLAVTKAGKKLNSAGAILGMGIAFIGVLMLFSSARLGNVKDAMMNHMTDLGTTAYRYRNLPASSGGGGGVYSGFVIPDNLSKDEYGVYTGTVVHPDTIRFRAHTTLGFEGTITVTIDSQGKQASPWMYDGDFSY
jgi:hypothetical protein